MPIREILTWLAISVGLIASTAVGLAITVYAAHIFLRLLTHFSISSPAPNLAEIAVPGLSVKFEKAEEVSEKLVTTVENLEARLRILEANQLKMLAKQRDD